MIVYNQCPTRILGLRVLGVGFRMFGLKGLRFLVGLGIATNVCAGSNTSSLGGVGGVGGRDKPKT